MTRSPMATLTMAFRRMAIPLAAYYTMTIVVPIANGAEWTSTAFVRHASVVLILPPAGIVLVCVAVHAARALARLATYFSRNATDGFEGS